MQLSSSSKQSNKSVKHFLIALVLVLVGIFLAYWIMTSKPKPGPKAIEELAPQAVEVFAVTPSTQPLYVTSQGSVVAKRETSLVSEIQGKVVYISPEFTVGGSFEAGQTLIEIDSAEYRNSSR